MSDPAFREVASRDLDEALRRYGYDLNDRERELVGQFRSSLAEANVDLFLSREIDFDAIFDDAAVSDVEALIPDRNS